MLVQNLLYGHEFDLYENEPVGGTHFQMNDFARRLVLTQRQKRTLKWVGKVPFLPLVYFSLQHSSIKQLFHERALDM